MNSVSKTTIEPKSASSRLDVALIAFLAAAAVGEPPKRRRAMSLWGRMTSASRWWVAVPSWAIPIIEEASRVARVPPVLVAAIAHVESRFRADAISSAGAIGIMQLMPATAYELGVDPYDPRENILGGARYIAEQIERFGNVERAIAAYNAGPAAVVRYGGIPPFAETRRYVCRVLEEIERRL